MPPMTFEVYTDGSGSTQGAKTGAYCSVIEEIRGKPGVVSETHTVAGGCFPTKVGKMELTAVNAALNYILEKQEGVKSGYNVVIHVDSTYVADGATGKNKRVANLAEWAMFDCLARGMDISISQHPRNSLKPQEHCDYVAGAVRKTLDGYAEIWKLER